MHPVDDTASAKWRSGQNRERLSGAVSDFGHRKSKLRSSALGRMFSENY